MGVFHFSHFRDQEKKKKIKDRRSLPEYARVVAPPLGIFRPGNQRPPQQCGLFTQVHRRGVRKGPKDMVLKCTTYVHKYILQPRRVIPPLPIPFIHRFKVDPATCNACFCPMNEGSGLPADPQPSTVCGWRGADVPQCCTKDPPLPLGPHSVIGTPI